MNAYCDLCDKEAETQNFDCSLYCTVCNGIIEVCDSCAKAFSSTEWDNRHWHGEGEYHETCCPKCNGKLKPEDSKHGKRLNKRAKGGKR